LQTDIARFANCHNKAHEQQKNRPRRSGLM